MHDHVLNVKNFVDYVHRRTPGIVIPRIATRSNSKCKNLKDHILVQIRVHDLTQIPEIFDMNRFNHGKSFRLRVKELKVP